MDPKGRFLFVSGLTFNGSFFVSVINGYSINPYSGGLEAHRRQGQLLPPKEAWRGNDGRPHRQVSVRDRYFHLRGTGREPA